MHSWALAWLIEQDETRCAALSVLLPNGESDRMEMACAAARGEVDDFPHEGHAAYDDLADAAWVAEVARALESAGADDVHVRAEANDRGIFWAGAWRDMPEGNGAGIYIDVIADVRTHHCGRGQGRGGRSGRALGVRACSDGGRPAVRCAMALLRSADE